MLRVMMMGLAAAAMALLSLSAPSQAQDWRRGEWKRYNEPHSFGALCETRFEAFGQGQAALFGGGGGKRRAQARAVEHWSERVSSALGPHYADWARSQGQQLSCDMRGLDLVCRASAHPCKIPREEHWRERGEYRWKGERDGDRR